MKKVLWTIMAAFLAVVMIYGFPAKADAAAVTGTCTNCHVMHASEGGTSATAYSFLARNTCIGCHTNSAYDSLGVQVNSATSGAAGTFLLSVANAANKRHDVTGWSTDGAGTAVPGNATSAITITRGALTCAGSLGCHGTHNVVSDAGIQGYHHASGRAGYRFLHYGVAAYNASNSIVGNSAVTRERGGATAANHNVYSASATQGISKFCSNCHATFHGTGNTGSATPFTRHPTDRLFSDTGWTLASVDTDYNTNPFAFTDYTTVTIGQAYLASTAGAQVACVSCHRAHGSAYAYYLRYDYTTMNAGNAVDNNGCENCHYKQR